MFGWRGRLLRVDLTAGTVRQELLDASFLRSCLGGLGLGAALETTAASKGDALVFSTAPLTGTFAPNGGRHAISARIAASGQTQGQMLNASVSGKWGPELKYAGYDALVIEGKSAQPVYLWIRNGDVELRPASHLWGKQVSITNEALLIETDADAVASVIGPAGENLIPPAAVVSDSFSAAGAGIGAVMGAKRLKAVVVRGSEGFRLADRERFTKCATELRKGLMNASIAAHGTVVRDAVVVADEVSWQPPPPGVKPARTRGCFGCATSFMSLRSGNGDSSADSTILNLIGGAPIAELNERLQAYRKVVDLGFDALSFVELASSADDIVGQARRLAYGELKSPRIGAAAGMQRGPCIAAGYAIVPKLDAGGLGPAYDEGLAILDSVGLCPFLGGAIELEVVAELLRNATGLGFSASEIADAGRQICRQTRQRANEMRS